MGAVNYFTSTYITIGYNLDFVDYNDEFYHDIISDYYEQAKICLEQKYFYYWHITIKPGYYEGFTIDIESNFPWCFDNYKEKKEALKEVTEIKKFLLECINDFECCAVFPGWCTSYKNQNESIKLLNAAVKEMKADVKNTCTWRTLPDSEKIPAF